MVLDSTQPILKIDMMGKDTGRHIQIYMPFLDYMEGPRNNLFGKYDLVKLMDKTKEIFYESESSTNFAPLSFDFLNMFSDSKDTIYDVTADIIEGKKAGELSEKHPLILKDGCIREKERQILKMHLTAKDGSQEIDVCLPFQKGMESILPDGEYGAGKIIQKVDDISHYSRSYNNLFLKFTQTINEKNKYDVKSEIINFKESYLEKSPDLMTKGIIREKNPVQSG